MSTRVEASSWVMDWMEDMRGKEVMEEMPMTNDHVKITKIGLSQNGYGIYV